MTGRSVDGGLRPGTAPRDGVAPASGRRPTSDVERPAGGTGAVSGNGERSARGAGSVVADTGGASASAGGKAPGPGDGASVGAAAGGDADPVSADAFPASSVSEASSERADRSSSSRAGSGPSATCPFTADGVWVEPGVGGSPPSCVSLSDGSTSGCSVATSTVSVGAGASATTSGSGSNGSVGGVSKRAAPTTTTQAAKPQRMPEKIPRITLGSPLFPTSWALGLSPPLGLDPRLRLGTSIPRQRGPDTPFLALFPGRAHAAAYR